MVDKLEAILKININYKKEQKEFELTDLLSLKELKKLAAEKFNIPKNQIDTIYFEYYDEEEDLNFLEEESNLIDISNKASNDNIYNLKLELKLRESCASSRVLESGIFKSQRKNISKSAYKENEINDDKKYEDLIKENLKLKNEIKEMEEIIKLEKEINNIERKKWDKEKKMMELKIDNLKKIEELKKNKNELMFNKYINELEKNIVDNIAPLLEEKIKSEIEAKVNNNIDKFITGEMKNILTELEKKLEDKKNEIINIKIKEAKKKLNWN